MTKYTNGMIAHMWANQSKSEAESSTGNFWFRGLLLDASYTRADGIARITDKIHNGKIVVLITTQPNGGRGFAPLYSSIAFRALDREKYEAIYVPYVNNHAKAVAEMFATYKERALRLGKPNVYAYGYGSTLDSRLHEIYGAATEYRTYCQIFGLDEPYPNFDYYTYLARTNFARYYDPKHVSQRNARAAKEHLRAATIMGYVHAYVEGVWPRKPNIKLLPRLMKQKAYRLLNPWQPSKSSLTAEQWLAGEGRASALGYHQDKTLVRRKDDRLETSQGAQVPWLDAVRVFGAAQQYRRMGREWHRNGSQYRVGHFQLDRIEADGTIKAGCHVISYDEMLRLAIQEIPYCVLPTYPLPVPVRNHDAQFLSPDERAIT